MILCNEIFVLLSVPSLCVVLDDAEIRRFTVCLVLNTLTRSCVDSRRV